MFRLSASCYKNLVAVPRPEVLVLVLVDKLDWDQSQWINVLQMVLPGLTCLFFLQQSLHRLSGERSHGKKSKEPKPRMKKLKYHQYIPPDQKQEHSDVPMDSAYARLLQQQQQFLQLQILKQQQQQYGRRGVRPVTLKYGSPQQQPQATFMCRGMCLDSMSRLLLNQLRQFIGTGCDEWVIVHVTVPCSLPLLCSRAEVQSVCSSVLSEDAASFPLLACHAPMTCKHLPANLDEMKVIL